MSATSVRHKAAKMAEPLKALFAERDDATARRDETARLAACLKISDIFEKIDEMIERSGVLQQPKRVHVG